MATRTKPKDSLQGKPVQNEPGEAAPGPKPGSIQFRLGLIACTLKEAAQKPRGVIRLSDCLIAYGTQNYASDIRIAHCVATFREWLDALGCIKVAVSTGAADGGTDDAWALGFTVPSYAPARLDGSDDFVGDLEDTLEVAWNMACLRTAHDRKMRADRLTREATV